MIIQELIIPVVADQIMETLITETVTRIAITAIVHMADTMNTRI